MRDIIVEEDGLLVGFDMSSLFTNVPIGEPVQVIQAKLREDDSLAERTPLSPDWVAELLDTCLKSTYFNYGGEFYEQREGAAVVANLYTEYLEELALEPVPRLWKRYMDDACCILMKGDVDGLLHHLHSIRLTIEFTTEVEEGGSLAMHREKEAGINLHITSVPACCT